MIFLRDFTEFGHKREMTGLVQDIVMELVVLLTHLFLLEVENDGHFLFRGLQLENERGVSHGKWSGTFVCTTGVK